MAEPDKERDINLDPEDAKLEVTLEAHLGPGSGSPGGRGGKSGRKKPQPTNNNPGGSYSVPAQDNPNYDPEDKRGMYDDTVAPGQEYGKVSPGEHGGAPDPSELSEREANGDQGGGESGESDRKAPKRELPWRKQQRAADEEDAALRNKLGDTFTKAKEEDDKLYKPDEDKDKKKGRRRIGRMSMRQKLAGGGIILSILAAIAGGGSFLNTFRLQHLVTNIDASTFSRFNASMNTANKSWMRAYLRIRLSEITGESDPNQHILVRGNRIDGNNPAINWYRTMRTSSFERELAEKQGIRFTSIGLKAEDGSITFRPARITMPNGTFDVTIDPGMFNNNIDDLIANHIDDVQGAIDDNIINVFETNAQARASLNKAVKDNTHWFQFLERRHRRRDIRELTGIKKWSFFDLADKASRGKLTEYEQIKNRVKRKLLQKVIPDTNSGAILKCLFGVGNCPGTTDTNMDETKADTGTFTGNPEPGNVDYVDENGNPVSEAIDGGNEIANGVDNSTDNALADELGEEAGEEVAQNVDNLSPTKKILINQIKELLGGGTLPQKILKLMDNLSKIVKFMASHKLTTLVTISRMRQVTALTSTWRIASDQMRHGNLSAAEVTPFMGLMKNMSHSEGYGRILGTPNTVALSQQASAATNNPCSSDFVPPTDGSVPYVGYCSKWKMDGDGIVKSAEDFFDGPIGQAFATYDKIRGPTKLFSNVFDKITGAVFDPITNLILQGTGLDKTIESVASTLSNKVMELAGGGPMFDLDSPIVSQVMGNLLPAGGAVAAELAMRGAGGSISTPASQAYMTKLVADYRQETNAQMSLQERYLSFDNPNSLATRTTFAMADSFDNGFLGTLSTMFSSITRNPFINRAYAAEPAAPYEISAMAGMTTYDVPALCNDVDPLTSKPEDYTNADEELNLAPLTYALINNHNEFWKQVDARAKPKNYDTRLIYNCGDWFRQSRGGLAGKYGYTEDDGYDEENFVGRTPINPTSGSGLLQSPPNLGPADANGYYQMPEALNGEYLIYSPPYHRCGTKQMIDLLYSAGLWWQSKYPGEVFWIGDINASGHLSHRNGVDVDVTTTVGTSEQISSNEHAIEFAKWLADQKIDGERVVKEIYYNIPEVQNAVNSYSGNPDFMFYQNAHYDHFHIRLQDKFRGPASEGC